MDQQTRHGCKRSEREREKEYSWLINTALRPGRSGRQWLAFRRRLWRRESFVHWLALFLSACSKKTNITITVKIINGRQKRVGDKIMIKFLYTEKAKQGLLEFSVSTQRGHVGGRTKKKYNNNKKKMGIGKEFKRSIKLSDSGGNKITIENSTRPNNLTRSSISRKT